MGNASEESVRCFRSIESYGKGLYREKNIEIDIQDFLNEYLSIDEKGNRYIHFKNFKLDSNEDQASKRIESKLSWSSGPLKRKNTLKLNKVSKNEQKLSR